jgi:hypothetical protein
MLRRTMTRRLLDTDLATDGQHLEVREAQSCEAIGTERRGISLKPRISQVR